MSTKVRLRQAWTIASLQLRRVFFSRRSLWVYLLAFFLKKGSGSSGIVIMKIIHRIITGYGV